MINNNIIVYIEKRARYISFYITKDNRKSLHTKRYKRLWTEVNNGFLNVIYIEHCILYNHNLTKSKRCESSCYINQSNIDRCIISLATKDELLYLHSIIDFNNDYSNFIQQLLCLSLYR